MGDCFWHGGFNSSNGGCPECADERRQEIRKEEEIEANEKHKKYLQSVKKENARRARNRKKIKLIFENISDADLKFAFKHYDGEIKYHKPDRFSDDDKVFVAICRGENQEGKRYN